METKLKAERREGTGKGVARRLRADGRVPGVLYGQGVGPIPLSVSSQDLLHLFHASAGATMLVDLEVDGEAHLAIPREVQRDHIHARYVHVDFLAVSRTEKVRLSVEVHEIGEAVGIKNGGVIEHHLRDVEIECLPGNVPEGLEVDISALDVGDMVRVSDIVPVEGVTILTEPDQPVVSIITPAALRTEVDLTVPGEEGEVPEGEAEAEAAPAEGEAPPAAEGEAPVEAGSEGGGEG
jgi:large subunit ribosomal protein L25